MSTLSVIISAALGWRIYWYARSFGISFLRAQIVTRLHKDDYLFPKLGELTMYYELKPHATDTDSPPWLGHTATYTINDDGLNAKVSYPVKKEADTIRIVAIGDSFTFGQYVNTQDSYPAQLEDLLSRNGCQGTRYEVLNLGVSGYDISYTVRHYEQKGQKYAPDLVIWFMNGHNFYQMNEYRMSREEEILHATRPEKRAEYEQQGNYYFAVDQAQKELVSIVGKKGILSRQKMYLEDFSHLYSGRLVLAVFDSMTDPDILPILYTYQSQRLDTWIDQGVPDLDARGEVFRDGHPNVKGYHTIAAHLHEYIVKNHLIPSCQ